MSAPAVLLAAVPLLGAWLAAGCDMPRDPEDTLDKVRGKVMRVGIMESPPWAQYENGQASGPEVNLVNALAGQLKAEVRWFPGGESSLMEALEHFELDLVIGGITEQTPWEKRIGISRPYIETHVVIAVPPGQAPIHDLKNQRIAVRSGDSAARMLRRKQAQPVEVADPLSIGIPAAIEDWQLPADWTNTSLSLQTKSRVLAVPPGENAWLVEVERFLHQQRGNMPALLKGGPR